MQWISLKANREDRVKITSDLNSYWNINVRLYPVTVIGIVGREVMWAIQIFRIISLFAN